MLDTIDRKILIELSRNARNSYANIAKKLRLSKDVVQYRVKKLEKSRVIQQHVTIVDYSKLGFTNFKVYLKLDTFNNQIKQDILDYLHIIPSLSWLTLITEDYDIAINLNERNVQEFQNRYKELIYKFARHIQKKHIATTTAIHHYDDSFLLNKKPRYLYTTGTATDIVVLNKTEKGVLSFLNDNARASLVNMAAALKKRPNTLVYAIRNLERKGVILGYKPLLDFQKLGCSYYKVLLWLKAPTRREYLTLKQALASMTNVTYITELLGDNDLEFEVVCRNQQELAKHINMLREKFPDLICDTRSRLVLSFIDAQYFPYKA